MVRTAGTLACTAGSTVCLFVSCRFLIPAANVDLFAWLLLLDAPAEKSHREKAKSAGKSAVRVHMSRVHNSVQISWSVGPRF